MCNSLPTPATLLVILGSVANTACSPQQHPEQSPSPTPPQGMVLIPGGTFHMGSEAGLPHEAPIHQVTLSPFYLDTHEVTNQQFTAFVQATGYVTEAEQWGWSAVYIPQPPRATAAHSTEFGWTKVDGATWRQPIGPGSTIDGKKNYPVVQVSWNDAAAYAEWAGKRLPTEAEWEFAARGGLIGNAYPWGNTFTPDGQFMANTWQGNFPERGPDHDRFPDLAPVGQFPPNAYGLYDIAGNVWEWCADWYDPRYYARGPDHDPQGPPAGTEKILRGGSWLCAENYCKGYRVSHRNHATPDSGLNNVGFRCAMDVNAHETDRSSSQ